MADFTPEEAGPTRGEAVVFWSWLTVIAAGLAVMIVIPLTGFLMVAAHDLILLLFTKTYLASVSIFALWALTTAAFAFPTDAVLRVYADTRAILWLNLVRLIFVASLIGFAISRFGLIGPVIVTLGSLFLAKALALGRISKVNS